MGWFRKRTLESRRKRQRELATASDEARREALQEELGDAKRTLDAATVDSATTMSDAEAEAAIATDLRSMKQRSLSDYELFLAYLPDEEADQLREIARKHGI